MALVKWDPWREIEDMFDRYTRAIGVPRRIGEGGAIATVADWTPQVDITEGPGEFTIKAEIPEVNKDDVKISIDDGVVTISGQKRKEKEEKDKTYHRIERFYGTFSRSFSLPDNINPGGATATFKDGVLTLQIPKTTDVKPKGIEVKIE